MTSWDDMWMLPVQLKRDVYGKRRIAVGGRNPDDCDDGEEEECDEVEDEAPPLKFSPKASSRSGKGVQTDMQPVAFHELPVVLYSELIWDFSLKSIIDLTPGSGNLAISALRHQIGYLGVVYSAKHAEVLTSHFEETMLQLMQDESSLVYDPALVKVVQEMNAVSIGPHPSSGKPPQKRTSYGAAYLAKPEASAKKVAKKSSQCSLDALLGTGTKDDADADGDVTEGDSASDVPGSGEDDSM